MNVKYANVVLLGLSKTRSNCFKIYRTKVCGQLCHSAWAKLYTLHHVSKNVILFYFFNNLIKNGPILNGLILVHRILKKYDICITWL